MNDTNYTKVIDALDVGSLPVEEQEALLLDLNELVFKGSMVRLIERMDEATREEFTALVDSDADDDVVEAFLRQHVPDADTAVSETIADITDDILSVTGTK